MPRYSSYEWEWGEQCEEQCVSCFFVSPVSSFLGASAASLFVLHSALLFWYFVFRASTAALSKGLKPDTRIRLPSAEVDDLTVATSFFRIQRFPFSACPSSANRLILQQRLVHSTPEPSAWRRIRLAPVLLGFPLGFGGGIPRMSI
jgi:hypothetical protein